MENKIKEIRKSKNITQEQLSKAIGVSRSVISKYENGTIPITLETMSEIAKALDVPTFELLWPYMGSPLPGLVDSSDLDTVTPIHVTLDLRKPLETAFSKLNAKGREVAVERVEELAKIPEYQRKEEDT